MTTTDKNTTEDTPVSERKWTKGRNVLIGDCRTVMKTLPDASFDCCVTSPPYYWQRDYDVEGQCGMEDTPEDFIANLVAVFGEVKRLLKPHGTVWLNLGDSYYSGNGQPKGSDPRSPSRNWMRSKVRPLDVAGLGVPKKSILMLPHLVARALQIDGWTVRADIVWCRETAFPEPSVKDRPHRQHEYLFLLSKSRWYHFDRSGLGEESVWHIPHERGKKGHSAAFPKELVSRCLSAGCKPGGSVIDPFGGSGTVGEVADRMGIDSTLIELNPTYATMARAALQRAEGEG